MKTNSTQQEILLLTGTTFSKREWCEKHAGMAYYLKYYPRYTFILKGIKNYSFGK